MVALGATFRCMASGAPANARVFKTKTFARLARKTGLSDATLCEAVREIMAGYAEDLGGGVWKKRIDENRSRAIVLAKGRRFWVLEYLFAKADRANIAPDELVAFRELAKAYERLQDVQLKALLKNGDLKEICDERHDR